LVVNLVLVARCSTADGLRPGATRPAVLLTWGVVAGTTAAIVAGTLVTGAGPHAGDETAPRLDLDIPSITRVHGVIVVCTIAVAVVLAVRVGSHATDRRVLVDAVTLWLLAGLVQAAIGYVQYFNDLPELLVGAHVAGAATVTLATTQLVLRAMPAYGDGSPPGDS
jgi:cytochrome c oxidase assembly protein subunit 15